MKIWGAPKKLIKQYQMLRRDEAFSPPAALACLTQSAYYRLFRWEEYGDMMSYHFIKFKHPDIYETMFTKKDNAALLPLVNDEAELPVLRKKHRLLQLLGDVGRRYFYVPDHSEEELAAFLLEGGKRQYILKPDDGAVSQGISFLYTDGTNHEIESKKHGRSRIELKALYQEMNGKNILVEEYIRQHEKLNAVFSGCVNTIFIHTARLPDGHAEVAGFLYMEFGCGDSRYVNSGNDLMIGVHGDGTLYPFGFSRKNGVRDPIKITQHPDSGAVFDGFQIPYWPQAVQLALDCAEKVPQLVYIKWDIAITEDGPVIIEGNGMPGGYRNGQIYSLEARHVGVKTERTEFLKALAFSKTLTPERVREVNRTLSDFGSGCALEDCDAVVVLGSARATSRIEAAFQAFGCDPAKYYVLCGGNASIHPVNPEKPDGEKLTEAEYMKRYLLDRGVREERIITDNASRNTTENLACAAEEINRIGAKKAALVSAWFHGRRVRELLSKSGNLGLSPSGICFIPAYGGDTKPDNWFRSLYGIKAIYHEWKDC